MNFLLLFLVLSLQTVKGAVVSKIFDIIGFSGNINAPEKLAKVISTVLAANISSAQVDSETSLFHLLNPIFASYAGLSESEQHKFYVEALFDHMNKACLAAMVKIKRGQLTTEERTEIIQKIWLTSHETGFFDDFKTKLTVPDKTVTLMLNVLKSLDMNSCCTRGMILKLAPFCESETSQELVYSSILNSLNCQNKKLPLISIKYNLKNTEKYDEFISSCCEIYESERSNIISLDNFVRNIFNGPGTEKASKIFLKIINKDVLIKISKHEESIKNLTRFLLNSKAFDEFIGRFFDFDSDETLEAMKVQMLKIQENYEAITAITSVNESEKGSSDSKFMGYVDLLRQHRDLIKDYYFIDPEFVLNTIRQLNIEIIDLIQFFYNSVDPTKKLVVICVTFIVLYAIPNLYLTEIPTINYEPLLDAYLRPEILVMNPNISIDHLTKVIVLPNAKLELSTLEKLFTALKRCRKQEAEERLHLATVLALYYRHFNDRLFLDALHIFMQFYESNTLDMNCIFVSLLGKFMGKGEYFLAHKLLKLGREKKLISKSFDILTERYLDCYGKLMDINHIEV